MKLRKDNNIYIEVHFSLTLIEKKINCSCQDILKIVQYPIRVFCMYK